MGRSRWWAAEELHVSRPPAVFPQVQNAVVPHNSCKGFRKEAACIQKAVFRQ